jgi:hypothetical protein
VSRAAAVAVGVSFRPVTRSLFSSHPPLSASAGVHICHRRRAASTCSCALGNKAALTGRARGHHQLNSPPLLRSAFQPLTDHCAHEKGMGTCATNSGFNFPARSHNSYSFTYGSQSGSLILLDRYVILRSAIPLLVRILVVVEVSHPHQPPFFLPFYSKYIEKFSRVIQARCKPR